jgi:hypothetical protein
LVKVWPLEVKWDHSRGNCFNVYIKEKYFENLLKNYWAIKAKIYANDF